MGAFPVLISMGQLTINPTGVSAENMETNLRAISWMVDDLSPFWDMPPTYGSNLRVPGADGTLPLERFDDEMVVSTGLIIGGDVGYTGTVYTNPLYGLRQNRDWLLANVHGERDGFAYRVAKLTLPYQGSPGAPLYANVQCSIALGKLVGANLRAVFTMIIPAGWFSP